MTIKIEKGVPLVKRASNAKYPWHEMEVGDSFYVPFRAGDDNGFRTRASLLSNARQAYNAARCVTSKIEGNGVRIWRIA